MPTVSKNYMLKPKKVTNLPSGCEVEFEDGSKKEYPGVLHFSPNMLNDVIQNPTRLDRIVVCGGLKPSLWILLTPGSKLVLEKLFLDAYEAVPQNLTLKIDIEKLGK